MLADSKEPELTDDEWREQKFSEEELMSAKLLGEPPTLAQLSSHMERFGPEGILESAILLPRVQYEKLEKLVHKAPKIRTVRRRRSR
jgi:hypothetical protein